MAFRAAHAWRPTVLQHLLLGMNAHINLDLGIACAEIAPGKDIVELETDFKQINAVFAGLIQTVQERLNRVSPLYRFVDDVGGAADRAVINFSIGRAREEAWRFATRSHRWSRRPQRSGSPTRTRPWPTSRGAFCNPDRSRRPACSR